MISENQESKPLSAVEKIKAASRYLRGTLADGLKDTTTGAISKDDVQVAKFHGLYQQDDRDQRIARRKAKLERAYSFMIRVRVPGGVADSKQYLVLDDLATRYGNGTVRLTTRQAFQLHGVLKGNLKPLIQEINRACMDSIAACGDVNRNVMCNPNPNQSGVHEQVYGVATKLSAHLTPRSRAYHEIWLDGELVAGGEQKEEEEEPIYGPTYLPRKFKIGIAVPPSNDVDIFSQDLGFIAIVDGGKVTGFNVAVGGGLGMTHGMKDTHPRLADVIGFCAPEDVNAVAEAVVTAQRDYGDRSDRRHARLKYTIEDRGISWFKEEVERRFGRKLLPPRPYQFDETADDYGWHEDTQGNWFFTLFVLSGRVKDTDSLKLKTGLREIALAHGGEFRLTPNQNLMITGVRPEKKPEIDAILKQYGLDDAHRISGLRRNALSCPALPTCGLALSESERVIPEILEKLEEELEKCGLSDDAISIRMTGCPNGCARPYLAEIGIVGKAPGKYNLYLGAKHDGTRLNREVAANISEDDIVAHVAPLFKEYAAERHDGERFGDFLHRRELASA